MRSTTFRRRRLLALGAVALAPAGCLRSDPAGDDSTGASDEPGPDATENGSNDSAEENDTRTATHGPTGHEVEVEYEHVTETLDAVPVAQQFDCAEADRPTPDVEGGDEVELEDGETVTLLGPLEYPDPPADPSDEAAVETFVEEHEEAYVHNLALERAPTMDRYWPYEVGVGVTVEEVARYDDQTFAAASVTGSSYEVDPEDGSTLHGDGPFGAVVYAVDGTGVARQWVSGLLSLTGLDDVWLLSELDPEEWDLLHCR